VKVLFDLAALARGGMERQVVDLASGLQERGHECMIVANKRISAYEEEIRAAGVRACALGRAGRLDGRVVADIAGLAREFGASVIVGVNFNATLWARVAARSLGVAAVAAEHSTDRVVPAKIRISNRMMGGFTDSIVACAQAQVSSLVREGNRSDLIQVVYNGVDTERFQRNEAAGLSFRREHGIPDDALVVGIVAAHRREKRHDRFIALLESLQDIDAWGLMVGGGPLIDATRTLVADSNARERLRVVGPVEDMPAAYSAMDLCTLCSEAESLPLALLESQACSTPVVVMSGGGVDEAVAPGQGFVVPQGDVQAMTTACRSMLADRVLARSMGASARTWVATYRSKEQMVVGYERLLQEAIRHADHRLGRA
jgi:glycosyltransferase involved in cell wall biosynthesis